MLKLIYLLIIYFSTLSAAITAEELTEIATYFSSKNDPIAESITRCLSYLNPIFFGEEQQIEGAKEGYTHDFFLVLSAIR